MKLRLMAVTALSASLLCAAESDAAKRLNAAASALKEGMAISDKSIPQHLLEMAQCMVVVPDLKKGAFIIGAKYGKGFVSCRKKEGVGWSAPGSVRVEGGSLGFQIGGSETDVFMLVMNERGADRLLRNKFTLGGHAPVAAGPGGRPAETQTDARLDPSLLP